MKGKTLRMFLLILTVVLVACTFLACNTDESPDTPSDGTDTPVIDETPSTLNKAEVFAEIKDGLLNAGTRIDAATQGTRHVTSEYTLRANSANLTLYYEANYVPEKTQDSEVMLRIYDYFANDTVLFVYYDGKDLYYDFKDQKVRTESFGSTSSFETFYNIITLCDMHSVLFGEDLASNVEAMASFAETKNISKIRLNSTQFSTTVKDVNLDKLKPTVNDFINNNIAALGNKFDALTSYLLGFEISDLAKVQIGLLTAKELFLEMENVDAETTAVTGLDMTFAGNQANNIDDYFFNVQYSTSYVKEDITLHKNVDPDTNTYENSVVGQNMFTGTLVIPSLSEELNADIRTILDSENNAENKISITFDNSTGSTTAVAPALAFYYKDGVAYLDCDGLIKKHFGNFFDYKALGLPLLKFDNINLATELKKISLTLLDIASDTLDIEALLNDEFLTARLTTLIDKSSSKNGVFSILIDSEFVKNVIGGESSSLAEMVADYFGVNDGIVQEIIDLGYLDDLALLLSYNTNNGDITLEVIINGETEATLALTPVTVPEEGVEIVYPSDGYLMTFQKFTEPDVMTADFTAKLNTLDSDNGNISKFMGLFIGDISGNNTPYPIGVADEVVISGSISQKDGDIFVDAEISINGDRKVSFVSDLDDAEKIYVDNALFGVKYVMSKTALTELITELASEGNVWTVTSVANALETIVTNADITLNGDKIVASIAPFDSATGRVDPLYELIGVKDFRAEASLRIKFDTYTMDVDPADYVDPVINVKAEEIFTSIYEVVWQDTATVIFGTQTIPFKLTFEGESAVVTNGKYEYYPEAKLFGKTVSYAMHLTDKVNGTKVIDGLTQKSMTIDPIAKDPIPDEIGVTYKDSTLGSIAYEIEGFPYSNENIDLLRQGMARKNYTVVIGKGSVAEARFTLSIEVLGRVLKTSTEDRYGDIPIVARVTIDPFEYYIRKSGTPSGTTFRPIMYRDEALQVGGTTVSEYALMLTFYKNAAGTETYDEYLEDFEWTAFDEKWINYKGGTHTITGKYKELDIALEINVQNKEIAYISINGEDGGYYTVDTLMTATYPIPVKTDANNDVRVYFTSGKYRVLGTDVGEAATDPDCDGCYDVGDGLVWTYPTADYLSLDQTAWPLAGETDTTTATFGNDLVGYQTITLKVRCPSRRIGGFDDFEKGITYAEYDANSIAVEDSLVYSTDVRLSYAWFGGNDDTTKKSFFEFDPYGASAKLPSEVYLNVEYGGKTVMRKYPITWSAANGVIDAEGNIRLARAEDTYLIVYGTVGDGEITQSLTMAIYNRAGKYSAVKMYSDIAFNDTFATTLRRYDKYNNVISDGDTTTEVLYTRYYLEGLIPYAQISLPKAISLVFPEASGMADKNVESPEWYIEDPRSKNIVKASEFIADPNGEEVVAYTDVSSSSSGAGMLSQRVEIYLSFTGAKVTQTRIYGVYESADIGSLLQFKDKDGKTVSYAGVDTYSEDSQDLYDNLKNIKTIGVGITDGSKVDGLPVEWTNLDEFLAALESPLGSSSKYNSEYVDDVIYLRGVIRKDTVQETKVSMCFKIYPKELGAIRLGEIDSQYTQRGNDGVTPIEVTTEVERVLAGTVNETIVTTTRGHNLINLKFNKYFNLRKTVDGVASLCTPLEYINYIFGAVTITIGSDNITKALEFAVPENFNDYVYGNATASQPGVTVSGNYVIFNFVIEKLSEGSCKQPFNVTLTFLKDQSVISGDDASAESVELFDADGNPLYETTDGYTIAQNYTVEYVNSGKVTYNNLVWYAEETIMNANGNASIAANSVVRNIPGIYFGFMGTRTVKLYTILPNGARYRRHISFYSKNINGERYSTADTGKYKVVDGVLTINNVYEYMPVSSLVSGLSTKIIPNETDSYISAYPITFSLINGWKPAADFAKADNPDEFDTSILSARINSNGLSRTLFATGEVRGYNGETQEIRLYISVVRLSGGQISHPDYEIAERNLVYDQYGQGERNGTFNLPKDIKVTFGTVNPITYTFAKNDNVKYSIKAKDSDTYTDITSITYNNKGHTLDTAIYGGPNEPLLLKITLPDGNDSLRLTVTFPNREIDKVSYAHATATGNKYIEGRYYVDPYDRTTYTLPAQAGFTYKGSSSIVVRDVTWTPYGDAATAFTADTDGNYRYNGGSVDGFGKAYLFYSMLPGFDGTDKDQYFVMQVFVLDRKVANMPDELGGTYNVDNPFTARVKDILSVIEGDRFKTLSAGMDRNFADSITALVGSLANSDTTVTCFDGFYAAGYDVYADYLAITSPVVPDIKWHKKSGDDLVPLTDDDLAVGGDYNFTVYGVLGYGSDRTSGEIVELGLRADKWRFDGIDGIDSANGYIIELNEYTGTSIADSFTVYFRVSGTAGETRRYIVFYPEDRANDENALRSVISWRSQEGESLSSVVFANSYKTAEANIIVTDAVYRLDAQMVGVDTIDFGYGHAASGSVDLVIDPLNPKVPLTAEARGALKTDSGTVMNLGNVEVDWTDKDVNSRGSIYNMPIGGGTREIECVVNVPGSADKFPFTVRVTYLNRKPYKIETTENGFTTGALSGNYYTLLQTVTTGTAEQRRYYFSINPTPQNSKLYVTDGTSNVYYKEQGASDYSKSAYMLPKTLRVTYPAYDSNSIEYEAIKTLGGEMYFTDIEWVLSRNVSLVGTDVAGGSITAMIRKFRVTYTSDGKEVTSELYDYMNATGTVLGGQYNLDLETLNRSVEYTYIIQDGTTKRLSSVPEGSIIDYQEASSEFYIDPYDISFPDDVYVMFSGSSTPYHATDIEWTYDEAFMKRTDVISGKIGADYMYLMGTMPVFGTELSIRFAIKGRNINVTVITPSGEETQEPLSGGTLYVIKGEPAGTQLPDHLYYRFEYADGTSQMASVPLEFSETGIKNINTDEAGRTYTNVKATLGKVDDDNIAFTIIVVDPKLYTIKETTTEVAGGAQTTMLSNGGFYSDVISVGVNAFGTYVAGPEVGLLPDKVVISDDGTYMDIVDIAYDMTTLTATVKCRYTFRSFRDSAYISGDEDGYGDNSDKMFVNFTVPIKTYRYNSIEVTNASSVSLFEKTEYHFPLGTDIKASNLPDTVNGITPFWTMDDINSNEAGTYTATCHFKNAYGSIITRTIDVIIDKVTITEDDIVWNKKDGVDFLNRQYSGELPLDIADFITIDDFLRPSGEMGALTGYTVMYSTDGGTAWSETQPTDAILTGSPNYLVRISLDSNEDVNVMGSVVYTMKISRRIIEKDDIYFHNFEADPTHQHEYKPIEPSTYNYINMEGAHASLQIEQVTFEYDGSEKPAPIAGIPSGVTYTTTYAKYNPNSTNQAYNSAITPVNAGVYIEKVVINANQRNFAIDSSAEFTIVITIKSKNVSYSLVKQLEYTGDYMHAEVDGLPDELKSKAMYSYTYQYGGESKLLAPGEKMRDVGTYIVTVTISGEGNYPDAVLTEEVKVVPRKVKLSINTVESEYLDPLEPLNGAITVTSVDHPGEDGLVGTDKMSIFGTIEVVWEGGLLTYKHMVGDYKLVLKNGAPTHKNYEFAEVEDGTYKIVAYSANTEVIDNIEQFQDAVAKLRDGDTKRWYLRAGDYGTLVIDKNASVSIIGSYDLTSATEKIAVSFDSISLVKGAIQLDIVSVKDKANGASVALGAEASRLNISRSEFVRSGTSMLTNSVAIRTDYGYKGTVYVDSTSFTGFQTAIYADGGSLEVTSSVFKNNGNGIVVRNGDLLINGNTFVTNNGVAVNIVAKNATVSVLNNVFRANDVAIRTAVALRKDIKAQNEFKENTFAIEEKF